MHAQALCLPAVATLLASSRMHSTLVFTLSTVTVHRGPMGRFSGLPIGTSDVVGYSVLLPGALKRFPQFAVCKQWCMDGDGAVSDPSENTRARHQLFGSCELRSDAAEHLTGSSSGRRSLR